MFDWLVLCNYELIYSSLPVSYGKYVTVLSKKDVDTKYDTTYNGDRRDSLWQNGINY